MKTLKESLLSDIDTTLNDGNIALIKKFIEDNFCVGTRKEPVRGNIWDYIKISDKPLSNGKYIVYTVDEKSINKMYIFPWNYSLFLNKTGDCKQLTNNMFEWGEVYDFIIDSYRIESLEGGPKIAYGSFDCSYANISSLKGAPVEVGGYFSCAACKKLKSLKYMPKKIGDYAHVGNEYAGYCGKQFSDSDIKKYSNVKKWYN